MKKAVIWTLLLLSGCSSMQDLRSEAPSNSYKSSKQVDIIANCILTGWQQQSQKYGSVFIQPYENGKTVYTQSQLEMADINRDGELTTIEFRHQGGLFSYRLNSRTGVIEQCL
ncbi:hypothetical protein I9Y19_005480 [Citrobacter freundii]|uniref:Lipoprotein n=1 Tax=Citrobacter freundii TaxID=546 RepID=A0ABY7L6N4_CITFR|nr:hypothetical protein [Citrobacter freundii]EIJ9085344.1 hypothetical protein [Citrobacter freundii]EJH9550192.1 hypothetical protein [Citrobacter freundii]EJO6486185.1 hypothetical protein [Citrobacter freundii]EKW5688687.1 hypothetical protein [Citrobacter freundii]EKX9691020.1 hypothetical protein [Citrobacter freundii]